MGAYEMKSPVFVVIDGLSELENALKWEKARAMLYSLWDQDRKNIELFLRLFSECWYLLCEWEVEKGTKGLSWGTFQNTLIECTTYGLEHFNQDIRFLWMGGYMISMFPYLFYYDEDKTGTLYLKWESKGMEMLTQAAKQKSCDISTVLYLGSFPRNEMNTAMDKLYREATRSVLQHLKEYFPGTSMIEQYFKEILNRNV